MERPEFCTDEMLTYLDSLRESGTTNMFGAGSYLEQEFPELAEMKKSRFNSSKRAREVLSYWMETFGKESR